MQNKLLFWLFLFTIIILYGSFLGCYSIAKPNDQNHLAIDANATNLVSTPNSKSEANYEMRC